MGSAHENFSQDAEGPRAEDCLGLRTHVLLAIKGYHYVFFLTCSCQESFHKSSNNNNKNIVCLFNKLWMIENCYL